MASAIKGGLQSELASAWINAADVIASASDSDLLKAGIPPGTRMLKASGRYRDALAAAKENGWLMQQRDALKGLTDLSEGAGDDAAALRYLKEYLVVKDTLLNADKAKAVSHLQIQYETEKKEQQIVLLGKDKEVQAKEIQKQKLVRNGFMGGFALVALFAGVFLFQRNRIGKEKKRSEELLLNILPAEVAEELKAKGEADAKQIDQVTVLFTDFKGFTAMSEKLTAKELVADIHECFSAFDHIMEKYGIEKIKTIGDAYMAAGGLPTPNTTHALDVVKAALEIRDFIAEGKAHKMAAGLPYFEIRIGIHTGPVVAGIVGVKKFAYDIWGRYGEHRKPHGEQRRGGAGEHQRGDVFVGM
ncbi:MAG: adenylate/guanylate cyclase domain-containing protein [Flavobacteriales bacterium]|nr:adenylate/guanylate cyclase domain-containing protein [Flavobacteriales bacterium]